MSFTTIRKWIGIELIEVSTTEKLVAALGGMLAIFALISFTLWVLPQPAATAVIASMGASAVLLFAVPHGQLSQPWPVLAGHGVSALIGVCCARWIPHVESGAALAVGLAIGAMHQLKCIHPPGGATAFTAVTGGSAIHDMGFRFILFPVLANAAFIILLAVGINWAFRWRRYPASLNAAARPGKASASENAQVPSHLRVVAAVRSLDSFVDISEDDLLRLTHLLANPRIDPAPPAGRVPQ